MSTTRELATWVSSIKYAKLPSAVVDKTKDIIFDCIGAMTFTGAKLPWGKSVADVATVTGGKQPESTIMGVGRKTVSVQAALANGTMAEGFELGDFDCDTATRPQTITVPPALALGEARHKSGKNLIEAVVAGYEATIRVGLGMSVTQRGRVIQSRGFYTGSLIGTYGAGAAAARILDLNAQKTTMALGISGALTGGYHQGHEEGAWTRRLNMGMASERGVQAALLAESDFIGPEKPLEGHFGFYRIFSNGECDLSELSKNPGEPYHVFRSWIKDYPMNGTLHAPVEALLNIMRANKLSPQDIAQIKSTWFQYMGFIGKKEVTAIASAQASLPFALAVSAVHGKCTVDEFTPKTLKDPRVIAMLDKVEVADNSSLYDSMGRETVPGRTIVTTTDGRVFTEEVLYPKGHPKNRHTRDELLRKFAKLTDGVFTASRQQEIFDAVMNLEKIGDLGDLTKLLIPSGMKAPTSSAATATRKVTKKAAPKKAAAKKAPSRKAVAQKAAAKKVTKKVAKKPAKKVAKKPVKKVAKKVAKKTVRRAAPRRAAAARRGRR